MNGLHLSKYGEKQLTRNLINFIKNVIFSNDSYLHPTHETTDKRSIKRLKSVYLKEQNTTNRNKYKYQQNFCTNLLRKTNFDYFCNLKVKDLNFNKTFWEKMKPFFSD